MGGFEIFIAPGQLTKPIRGRLRLTNSKKPRLKKKPVMWFFKCTHQSRNRPLIGLLVFSINANK